MTAYASPTEDYQTIDRLNARIEELTAALRPFAACYKQSPITPDDWDLARVNLTHGDFKQAAESLKGTPQ